LACRARRLVLVTLVMLLWGLIPHPCRGENDLAVEYGVKAAYLVKFPKYIEWSVPQGGHDELVIGIMGDPEMWQAATLLAEKRGNRTLKLRRVIRVEDMEGCRLVFIGVSEKGRLGQIVESAERYHVLTVSDIRRFVHAGGGIGFVNRGKTIRFEVNNRAARAAGATISSNLLRLADTVVE
jgi:hypothetical protein